MNQLVSEIKLALEEIKRLKGKVDSLNSVTAGVGSGTSSGVLLSDLNPLPVGAVADPGVGNKASRYDHVHVDVDSGSQYRQFVYEVSGGTFNFLTDIDGFPIMVLLDLE